MSETPQRGVFYKKAFACLLDGGVFDAWRMYPSVRNKYERLDEHLDVPYYDTAPTGEFSNALLQEVRVCPTCAFASNDDAHFKSDSAYVTPIDFGDSVLKALSTQALARREKVQAASTLYQCPRSAEDAVTAYKIAILTSTTIYNAEPRRFAGEAVRLANYALKLSRIFQELRQPEMREGWRRAAYEYLTKSLDSDIRGVTRWRGLYQLSALAVYFGDDRVAARTFETLRKAESTDPDRELSRYLNRTRQVWDNRDLHRASSLPAPTSPA